MAKTILSISSNSSILFLLETRFQKHFKFLKATDVFEGFLKLRQHKADLVIVDVDYDTEESWNFIQHIKTSNLYRTPVIVLFSDTSKVNPQLYDFLVDDFFCKPFNPIELYNTAKGLCAIDTLIATS